MYSINLRSQVRASPLYSEARICTYQEGHRAHPGRYHMNFGKLHVGAPNTSRARGLIKDGFRCQEPMNIWYLAKSGSRYLKPYLHLWLLGKPYHTKRSRLANLSQVEAHSTSLGYSGTCRLNPQTLNPQLNSEPLSSTVPLKWIEYGFGYIILIRSRYTPYFSHLRGTIVTLNCKP